MLRVNTRRGWIIYLHVDKGQTACDVIYEPWCEKFPQSWDLITTNCGADGLFKMDIGRVAVSPYLVETPCREFTPIIIGFNQPYTRYEAQIAFNLSAIIVKWLAIFAIFTFPGKPIPATLMSRTALCSFNHLPKQSNIQFIIKVTTGFPILRNYCWPWRCSRSTDLKCAYISAKGIINLSSEGLPATQQVQNFAGILTW